MGAGKSTRAKKMGYDVVIGTDTGKISGGKYERPADVNKVRQAKLQRALTADARGKKVLIEGHPNGVERIFGPHVGRISKVMEIDTKPSVAMARVKSRAAKRGSSVVGDVRAAKFYNRLYSKSLRAISQGGKTLKKIGAVTVEAFSDELQKIAASPKDDANALFGLPLLIKRRPGTRKYETEGSGAAASPDRSTSPISGQSTANVAGSNTITPATGPGGV